MGTEDGLRRRDLLSGFVVATALSLTPRTITSALAQQPKYDYQQFISALGRVAADARNKDLRGLGASEMLEWAFMNRVSPPEQVLSGTPLDPVLLRGKARAVTISRTEGIRIFHEADDKQWLDVVMKDLPTLSRGYGNGVELDLSGRRIILSAGHVLRGAPASAKEYRIHYDEGLLDLAAFETNLDHGARAIEFLSQKRDLAILDTKLRNTDLYGRYVQGLFVDPDERASALHGNIYKHLGGIVFPAERLVDLLIPKLSASAPAEERRKNALYRQWLQSSLAFVIPVEEQTPRREPRANIVTRPLQGVSGGPLYFYQDYANRNSQQAPMLAGVVWGGTRVSIGGRVFAVSFFHGPDQIRDFLENKVLRR